jgi:hypothetical protein
MKTHILTLVLVAFFGVQSFAAEGKKEKKEAGKELNREILSPELEALFLSGRLGETVVKPVYTQAEQVIFTEQLSQLKKEKH